jgi:hypothetical protein
MQTIRMVVSDKVFDNLMWFLSRFNLDEIQVITEGNEYISIQNYLQHELKQVEEGKMEYLTLEQLDQQLEETINKHED